MERKYISLGMLGLILFFCCFCILYNANWLFCGSMPGDDYQFLMTTAVGKASHGATWSSRFWPLGLSDYSILLLFGEWGRSAFAHYFWNCVILISSCLLMFNFLQGYCKSVDYYSAFISLLFIFSSAGFAQIHMECISAERMIFFVISLFLFAVNKAEKTQKNCLWWYVIAFIFAVYATYMKETVFIIFLIISTIKFIFDNNFERGGVFLYCSINKFINIYSNI